jgi:hypothetical protein
VNAFPRIVSALSVLSSCLANGQGSFIYDQQSSTVDNYAGSAYTPITENQPVGQSFTPALAQVGFVRLWIGQGVPVDTSPATFAVNLRANSITGQIIGSSQVTLSPGFIGAVDFLFSTPITVNPETTYFLQPEVQVGGAWGAAALGDIYAGGTIYGQGTANPQFDLWFREGVLVPEPSLGLIVIGGTLAGWRCKKKRRPRM